LFRFYLTVLPHLFGHRAGFLLEKLEVEQRHGNQGKNGCRYCPESVTDGVL